jgi:uncharacterized delta-60 repeat protein
MSSGFDFLARHNADGTRDNSFSGVQPSSNVRKIITLPDGKLLIAGPFTFVNSTPVGGIARLNPDGIDSTFNPGGAGANNAGISDMELLPDGKILIGGSFTNVGGPPRERLARLNPNGSLDLTFNSSANALVFDINLQSDGKILSRAIFSCSITSRN